MKFGLKAKLIGLIMMVVVLSSAIGGSVAYINYVKSAEQFKTALESMLVQEELGELRSTFSAQTQEWKNILLRGHEAESREKYMKSFFAAADSLSKKASSLKSLVKGPAVSYVDEFLQEETSLVGLYKSAIDQNLQQDHFQAQAADLSVKGKDRPLGVLLKKIEDSILKESHGVQTRAQSELKRNLLISAGGYALGVVALLVFSFLFVNKVCRQVSFFSDQVFCESDEVAKASGNAAKSAERISQASLQQAAAVQQTTAAMDEINATLNSTVDMIQGTVQVSRASQDMAQKGARHLDELMNEMEQIQESNRKLSEQTEAHSHEFMQIIHIIQQIGEKTKVINDIVFQTKLLSFNASVEAARAGEHGKGFSVVAEEVGNLARMSGQAAMEISGMLESSARKVQEIVERTKQSVFENVQQSRSVVERGFAKSKETQMTFEELKINVEKLDRVLDQVTVASREQKAGVGEVLKAVTDLSDAIESNNAISQESTQGSQMLQLKADSLKKIVDQMTRLIAA